ncbi:uncharacterized protein N7459_007139 [Penicillium hispanicum]|uniref:uncharacterized protein n=1 Tax=Penicillium hispanicum TaxID=1080232 RepID=UPI0025421943|nr:uncharacterized protein N7459_007139 [Penicillium hispanicum]KAJ5578175.1 hypothetical protein N7459_007139 [Penicillium hispanicum]
MLFFVPPKSRGPLSLLRAYISRRVQRSRDAATATHPAEPTVRGATAMDTASAPSNQIAQAADDGATRPSKRDMPCGADTDRIVNQLAVLAATVSGSSRGITACTKGSPSPARMSTATIHLPDATDQEETRDGQPHAEKETEEEESFHYLRSLITVSCLSQHSSRNASTASISSPSENPLPGRKRASSRLSLRLGDLPALPFPPKISRKPCPRYTTLPPVYTPKPIAIRPEVRF